LSSAPSKTGSLASVAVTTMSAPSTAAEGEATAATVASSWSFISAAKAIR